MTPPAELRYVSPVTRAEPDGAPRFTRTVVRHVVAMSFKNDGTADTVQTTFDPGTESAVRTVVETVSTVIDVDPLDMDPFGNHVDPDALETLCRAGERPGDWMLQFQYEGTTIRVTGDGLVRVRPAE